MLLQTLHKRNEIHPPKWLPDNTAFMVVMGSQAYGVSLDTSDQDIYGFCIPPKELVFPHLAGEILDFGTQTKRFNVWQEHHVKDVGAQVERDFCIYGITKYFHLCMENNPNMIDSLFVPRNCVIHSTAIGEVVREHRKEFLHKGAWQKFKGYAYAQASKIINKTNSSSPKRAATIEKYGYDTKFAYHCIRLMNEVEQILIEGDLDLQRNNEQLKSIRRGEWTLEDFRAYFTNKENLLETAYANSPLPSGPDEAKIKELLLSCLEMHYGSLSVAIQRVPSMDAMLLEISDLVTKYSKK